MLEQGRLFGGNKKQGVVEVVDQGALTQGIAAAPRPSTAPIVHDDGTRPFEVLHGVGTPALEAHQHEVGVGAHGRSFRGIELAQKRLPIVLAGAVQRILKKEQEVYEEGQEQEPGRPIPTKETIKRRLNHLFPGWAG